LSDLGKRICLPSFLRHFPSDSISSPLPLLVLIFASGPTFSPIPSSFKFISLSRRIQVTLIEDHPKVFAPGPARLSSLSVCCLRVCLSTLHAYFHAGTPLPLSFETEGARKKERRKRIKRKSHPTVQRGCRASWRACSQGLRFSSNSNTKPNTPTNIPKERKKERKKEDLVHAKRTQKPSRRISLQERAMHEKRERRRKNRTRQHAQHQVFLSSAPRELLSLASPKGGTPPYQPEGESEHTPVQNTPQDETNRKRHARKEGKKKERLREECKPTNNSLAGT